MLYIIRVLLISIISYEIRQKDFDKILQITKVMPLDSNTIISVCILHVFCISWKSLTYIVNKS